MNKLIKPIITICIAAVSLTSNGQDDCNGSTDLTEASTGLATDDGSGCTNLTGDGSAGSSAGAAWCTTPINLMTTSFCYSFFVTLGGAPGAQYNLGDGFAFVLQEESSDEVGGPNGGIGYGNGGASACIGGCNTPIFAVEWDPIDNTMGAGAIDEAGGDGCGGTDPIHMNFQYDSYEDGGGSYTSANTGDTYNESDELYCDVKATWFDEVTATFNTQKMTYCWDHDADPDGDGFGGEFTVYLGTTIILQTEAEMDQIFTDPTNVYMGMTAATGGQRGVFQTCLTTTVVSATKYINADIDYKNGAVSLNWHVAKHDEASYYIIQSSSDALNWENVTILNSEEGKLIQSIRYNYNYNDESPSFSSKYYRIVEYNKNDEIELYSEVLIAPFYKENLILTYNNFDNGHVSFSAHNVYNSEDDIKVILYGYDGKEYYNQSSQGNFTGDIYNLAGGFYFMTVIQNENSIFRKILVR